MTKSDIRLGLIGAGGIGSAYLQAAENSTSVTITAVADEDIERARTAAEQVGAATLPNHRALIEEGACDAVVICTPPSTHVPLMRDLVDAQVHVLCEKPFALDAGAARAIVMLAKANEVIATMASKFRYVDDVAHAQDLVRSGALGDLVLVENSFSAPVDMRGRWNAVAQVSGGGVIVDNGTHSVDLVRAFAGPISHVHAVPGPRIQGLAVEDTAQLFAQTINGVNASIELSWSVERDRTSYLEIHGTSGTARLSWNDAHFRSNSQMSWTSFGTGYRKLDALQGQLENFCAAITDGQTLRVTPDDAIASVEVVQAAYASMNGQHWLHVPNAAARQAPDVAHETVTVLSPVVMS